jgi:glycosyltransferase involved in cell wall biosynthesis
MRILLAHYFINDFGGLINNTEGLIRGFAALGHEAVPYMLEWKKHEDIRGAGMRVTYGESESVTGYTMDQRYGLRFPPERRIGYKGTLKHWRRLVREFDLVLWQIPVPTMLASNRHNDEWPDLYDLKVPQVGYSHDGNIFNTPWISLIANQWRGLGCVHPCALHGALKALPLPMSLTPSPQWDIEKRMAGGSSAKDRKGWLSLQTFKRWKRVDSIIRAIPYMKHRGPKMVAGGGIERYYMTSPDKVKPIYTWRSRDKGVKPEWINRPIWQVAEEHGLDYLDFVGNQERDDLLRKRVALIDASWADSYAKYGAHFNRVAVDALICGAVPIMRDWRDPSTPLRAHSHYVPLPSDEDPEKIAKVVDMTCKHDWSDWIRRARDVLPLWDCKNVAATFLELAEGRGTHQGKRSAFFYADGKEKFEGFFAK